MVVDLSSNYIFFFIFQFFRMIRGTANESDDRQRINNVAMLDGPIDREEDMENTDREENKDLEQENDELKVRNLARNKYPMNNHWKQQKKL